MPQSTPVQQSSKAHGAGKGSLKGTTLAGAVVTVLMASGVLPEAMQTAEVGAAIGVLLTGVAGFVWSIVDSYLAPANASD